jgi:ABC-type transporter Mla subunit MlaD
MTDNEKTKEDYEKEIQQLKDKLKEAEEAKGFDDIKKKYEDLIAEKDKTIKELEKTVDETNKKVDTTIKSLNDEVDEKLKQSEEYKQLLQTVEELQKDKAEATVDAYIQKGIILPKQKDVAVKLCLNDPDTFQELYHDAKPIVNIDPKPQSQKVNVNEEAMVDYFKN